MDIDDLPQFRWWVYGWNLDLNTENVRALIVRVFPVAAFSFIVPYTFGLNWADIGIGLCAAFLYPQRYSLHMKIGKIFRIIKFCGSGLQC
jgi:hypothetical protein